MAITAMDGLKFGADPELFVVNSDGEFVCPTFVPGTKDEPFPVKGGAVQRDGMAAEFNIDPVTTYEGFAKNIKTVMSELEKFLPSGHKLVPVPSATFSEKVWEEAPEDAKVLGCSPDFNAWTGEVNPPPKDVENPYLRTAAGHLHFGWTDEADMSDIQHIAACRDLVKQLDWYLGAWSVRLDKDAKRRRLYGKAGAMRFKPYGVEYRVLSNFWLANPTRIRKVWDRMQTAIWDMSKRYIPTQADGFSLNPNLIECINESKRNSLIEEIFHFPVMEL